MHTINTLVEAASTGNEQKVDECLREGLDIDALDSRGLLNPLMVAVFVNNVKMVRFLISRGAQVRVSDKNGRTPLMIAIDQNYIEMFDLLIAYDADIHASIKQGDTTLDLAIAKNRLLMSGTLKLLGARRNRYWDR